MFEIDGSHGSGGGSILRFCTALAAITAKPVRVVKIRAGRPKPGLAAQHLEGIKAAAILCNAQVKGAYMGSTTVEFIPQKISSMPLGISIGTAGSIGLVFQTLSLFALGIEKTLGIKIKGGATFGKFAPPLPYAINILLPALSRLGIEAKINIIRHGFYPSGGAKAEINLEPCSRLKSVSFEQPENNEIKGVSIASAHLKSAGVAERQAGEAASLIKDAKIDIEYADSDCPGSGIVLWSGFRGADGLGERGKKAEAVGKEAGEKMLRVIKSGACIDSHLADQLVPFMAIAGGTLTCPEMTEHLKTSIWLVRQFVDCDIKIEESAVIKIIFKK